MTDDKGAEMEDIAKRFQRLLWILQQLSHPGGTTSGRLADLYKVSQRSIQRDIIDLKKAGFEILSKGRRLWLQGSFNSEDLQGVLSQALSSCLLSGGDDDREADAPKTKALNKLSAFVRGDRKVSGDAQGSMWVGPVTREPWFPELMTALSENRTARFSYQALGRIGVMTEGAEAPQQRLVDPWTLLCQSSSWYLHGYDHSRGEPGTFKLNRIRSVEITQDKFAVPAQHRAEANVFHRWDTLEGRKRKVLCRVSPSLAEWLEENPVHPSQSIEDNMLELQVRDLDRVASWILGLVGIEVLRPTDLRTRVRQRAQEIVERHRRAAALAVMPTAPPGDYSE